MKIASLLIAAALISLSFSGPAAASPASAQDDFMARLNACLLYTSDAADEG